MHCRQDKMPSVSKHFTERYANGIPIPVGKEVTLNVRKEYLIQFEILRGRKNSEQTESISKKIIYTSLFRANMAN